jgi:hypothetical protein
MNFSADYVWCPQVKKNGSRNIFYEFMRLVRPGDLIFSYAGGVIRGIGTAKSHAYNCPRPDEFGHIGEAWDIKGWRVDVHFVEASVPLPPKDVLDHIEPYIGVLHSPLNANGTGRQSVDFAAIPNELGAFLQQRLGHLQKDPTIRSSFVINPSWRESAGGRPRVKARVTGLLEPRQRAGPIRPGGTPAPARIHAGCWPRAHRSARFSRPDSRPAIRESLQVSCGLLSTN